MELGLGASVQISANASLYGSANYLTTFGGDSHAYAGKVEMKFVW